MTCCNWKSKKSNYVCTNEADKSGYCLFHKPNKSKIEKEEFIKLIIERKINDFSGFIFDMEFNPSKVINYEYEELRFDEAVFEEDVDFSNMIVKKNIFFNYTVFKKNITFKDSIMIQNCTFYKTKFNENLIKHKVFNNTLFKGQLLVIDEVENFPRLDGVEFGSCTKIIMKNIDYDKEHNKYGKINYRIAKNQAVKIGNYENTGNYYYNERKYGGISIRKSDYLNRREYLSAKFLEFIARHSIGYGEKPWNIAWITIGVISLFALFYMFSGVKILDEIVNVDLIDIKNYTFNELAIIYINLWYFSIVTFTTVGYGDIVPYTIYSRILVVIEVILGILMAGIIASVIIKRMIK